MEGQETVDKRMREEEKRGRETKECAGVAQDGHLVSTMT